MAPGPERRRRRPTASSDVAGNADTPWLTPDELSAWLVLIRVASHLPLSLDRRLQQVAGITHFEYFVLSRLSESPGRCMRMSDLAGLTDASNARLSHVAARLEARGLIDRRLRPDDRRSVDAVLTEAGLELVLATAPDHVRHVRSLVIDPLDPQELEQLRTIGEKVLQRIQQERPEAAGAGH